MNDINNVASSPDQMSNPPPEGNGPLTQLSAPRGPASKIMVGDLNWLLGWLGVSDETAPRRPLSLHRHLTSLRNRRTRNIRRLPLRSQRPSPRHRLRRRTTRPSKLPRNPGILPKTWRRAGRRSAPRCAR